MNGYNATKRELLGHLFRASNRLNDRIEKARESNDWKKHRALVAADARVIKKIDIVLSLYSKS